MAYRQKKSPNLSVSARRGWCLGFVDDAVSAPARKATAQIAYNTEKANGTTRAGEPPVGLWVPIWFSLSKGPYAGLGHVAWAYNHGNGWIEIHDSETRAGARAVYSNINQVLAWFGNHGIKYLGWSLWVDGAQIIEEYTPPPAPSNGTRKAAKGTARVVVDKLNVRNAPNTGAGIAAQYSRGQTFNYDSYIITNGFVWLSYISYSGARRYVAEGPDNGKATDVYVSGGVSR